MTNPDRPALSLNREPVWFFRSASLKFILIPQKIGNQILSTATCLQRLELLQVDRTHLLVR